MHYFCISFTHKNTDLSLRERLSLNDEKKKKEFLKLVLSKEDIVESLVISTCNRVEILAFVKDLKEVGKHIITSLALLCEVDKNDLEKRADFFEDSGAIHHLFSVASSLDSLVIGETQITGQIKEAFHFAKNLNFCAEHLEFALHHAFKCAAKVRNQTQISKNPISIASVAVAKAKELLDLSQVKAIVIGAGEMAQLTCKHLLQAGAKIIILNRDLSKAQKLSEELDCEFDRLENLENYLNAYSLFFSATNAKNALITNDMLKSVEFKRYFFDIAVPRDIELSENDNIKVFAVDDLEEVVRKNLALRECEASIAYGIIGAMTSEFFKILSDLALTPTIKALRLKAKACANQQLQIALSKGYLKKSDEEEARKLIHQVFKAFLHEPTLNLKHLQGKKSEVLIQSLNYLFNLGEHNEI
ncbi:TPA: glutamyl-tRNA reductase [Campylobacter upsaliensis]|uniref:glutamyl-tRNA reductase n=1 Tax=Campylobacter upsaliensis TaxID=28080 RepID=UPI0022EA33A4|nr:glutamyl-tRNA reductase [Campylobacter upsaliensis]HEC1236871.1 glutamyl-tRNA reductase [Campylobacter upsaliensis]HEC1538498.1 glutamyl-tRNA reductase [Campylobacter upsaliensis]HEC1558980.1 glutamyl-tRNA reductase [Campylobacter upsaliensis]HEC1562288.1 glutamyl-tRNA reductase [Campylobacter upsaliensis]HEO8742995.1 glutamyl-tRNA reductase [Campylobacter upsaliensis]